MNGNQESTSDPSAVPSAPASPGIRPAKGPKLTQERARELFDYREDGQLIWRVRASNRASIGSVVGSLCKTGYRETSADGGRYLIHRLIWLWHYGYFPEHDLDHIDRDRLNNRIENLREASRSCNLRNTGNSSNNTSGVKGVCWCKNRGWYVWLSLGNRTRSVGHFLDITEAVAHRLAAEQCLGWEGCDSCSPAYQYMVDYLRNIK